MTYYIDLNHGSLTADGLTPENARLTYTDLELKPGDTVLFKRGGFIRDCLYRIAGAPGAPITYGAYGDGENPVFCGSVDVSDPALWVEVRPHVWQLQKELENEVCNFIYDDGRIGATLRWEEAYLAAQGDWYDSSMGYRERSVGTENEQKVFLWSDGNPGEVYSHIECAIWGKRWMSANKDWTVTEDLCFWGSGVHGMAGGADNVVIRRCSFCFIGGAVWNKQLRIRFGNAIEFWDHGENILIEDCYFNNIYDSAITHQGSGKCLPAKNLVMRGNLFINYGMGAYEGRDRMSIDSCFNDNICIGAGGGFSGFGDTKPRNSEIYPQPMGHHVFMWRIPEATEGGRLEFARNRKTPTTEMESIRDLYSILLQAARASEYLPTKKQERVAPAVEYISQNYTKPITNRELAALTGLSTVYFRKLFTEVMGTSPMVYARRLRIEKARELLQSDYGTLTDLAQSLGYASLYDFSRDFKKHTGTAPSHY